MKKTMTKLFAFIGVMITLFAFGLTSCEGPEGPAGPTGPIGGNGSVICGECHNLTTDLYAKIIQYEASTHYLGGNFERNGTSCARCHTHEGFLEYVETGGVAESIKNPTPINCRTCHMIHETYTPADYALTVSTPFVLDITDTKASFDMGQGNLCATCHQPRMASPMPEVGGMDIDLTNKRWGYHHGPQAALMVGEGGYEIPGSLPYDNLTSKHYEYVDNGCVDCHMANAYGAQAGGHTFNVGYLYHDNVSPNMAACTDCHTDATNFDVYGGQTEVEHLLDSLQVLLTDAGIYDNGYIAVPATYSPDDAGCYLNYQFLEEDRSSGVHNLGYAKALLTNSIEYLNTKK